jgi:probable rRNA maturation factor
MRTSARQTSRNPTRSGASQRLSLAIQNVAGAADLPARSTLRRWLARALRESAAVTIRFVGAAEGRALNRTYRGRDYPTNVLTFAYGGAGEAPHAPKQPLRLAGDIVLCVPVLRREARAQRKSLRAHCAHLVIHGALHLAGFDHEKAKDAKVMEALETEMLESLGYDDPYATICRSGSNHASRPVAFGSRPRRAVNVQQWTNPYPLNRRNRACSSVCRRCCCASRKIASSWSSCCTARSSASCSTPTRCRSSKARSRCPR